MIRIALSLVIVLALGNDVLAKTIKNEEQVAELSSSADKVDQKKRLGFALPISMPKPNSLGSMTSFGSTSPPKTPAAGNGKPDANPLDELLSGDGAFVVQSSVSSKGAEVHDNSYNSKSMSNGKSGSSYSETSSTNKGNSVHDDKLAQSIHSTGPNGTQRIQTDASSKGASAIDLTNNRKEINNGPNGSSYLLQNLTDKSRNVHDNAVHLTAQTDGATGSNYLQVSQTNKGLENADRSSSLEAGRNGKDGSVFLKQQETERGNNIIDNDTAIKQQSNENGDTLNETRVVDKGASVWDNASNLSAAKQGAQKAGK